MKSIAKLFCLAWLLMPAITSQAVLTVTKISAGGTHSLFVKSDGSLWGMGDNGNGQLGAGSSFVTTNRPYQIEPSGVTTISAGQFHSLFRESDGSLWAMGYNLYGQLGDGANTNHYVPELIESNQVGQISAGYYHSLFAKFHNPAGPGSFLGMGLSSAGGLGGGMIIETNRPREILSVAHSTAVSAISAGQDMSLFVEPDGSLWSMGWNDVGQLGDGTTNDSFVPELIVPGNVTAIATGFQHSLLLMSDGSLWGMGGNFFGQLGDGSTNDVHGRKEIVPGNVIAIAAGGYHSLFIMSDGSLWAMGYNRYCQLGDGTTNDSHVPEKIVPTGVTAVSAGAFHSLFTRSEGSLFGMGHNDTGELGDGTYTDRHHPVLIVTGVAPIITSFSFSGTTAVLNATNGFAGRSYVTLVNTNLTDPLNQWSPIATNVLSVDGNFTATAPNGVDPNASQQFYILELL